MDHNILLSRSLKENTK